MDSGSDVDDMDGGGDGPGGQTLYEVLLCAPDATETQLRQAYKQQALHWHPDKNSDEEAEERFKLVNTAWQVLSDPQKREDYDRSLARGDSSYDPTRTEADNAAAVARECWQAFMEAERIEKARQVRRERGLLVGIVSLFFWVIALQILLWISFGDSPTLYSSAVEIPNANLARDFKRELEFKQFGVKLQQARSRHDAAAPYYVRILLNESRSELRRAPEVGRPNGRGWLLVSAHKGEDIYGREINLVTNTFLYFPEAPPKPWPATTLCASLLRSGPIKQKEWWDGLSRALGGRLRPFGLALVSDSECDPKLSMLGIGTTTAAALAATVLTVRVVCR